MTQTGEHDVHTHRTALVAEVGDEEVPDQREAAHDVDDDVAIDIVIAHAGLHVDRVAADVERPRPSLKGCEESVPTSRMLHAGDRPTSRHRVHLLDSALARAAIARALEQCSSRCLDDDEDRKTVAEALATALQLDDDYVTARSDAREDR